MGKCIHWICYKLILKLTATKHSTTQWCANFPEYIACIWHALGSYLLTIHRHPCPVLPHFIAPDNPNRPYGGPSTHSLQTAHTCYQENILANEHAKHVKGNNTHGIRACLLSYVMFLLCGKFMFYDENLIYSVDVVNIAMQVCFSICWNNYPDEYPCRIYNAEIKMNVCFD